MTVIRVLVVDDHTLFRDGLSAILINVPDIDVVGEAGTGREAVTYGHHHVDDVGR
jgi:two-component system nitrate/nitrite response regulator NarL